MQDILSRPILLSSFNWNISNVAGDNLYSANFPAVTLTHAMYSSKINNFYGFRADIVLRLVCNAERFQQGRLLLNWFPQGDYMSQRYAQAVAHRTFMTQLPRVDFDCSGDTEVILKVPYVSPLSHYNVVTGEGQIGNAGVYVYSPLISPTGSAATIVQLWAYYENIHLDFPARPQSERSVGRGRALRKRTKNVAEKELEDMGGGPISKILGATSSLATALGRLPMLTAVMEPVSWASSILANTAASFGWSNPHNSQITNRMLCQQFAYCNNANGMDNSQNMGVLADALVAPVPDFCGTSLDEMSIQYIAQIPAFYADYQWTTSLGIDTYIFNLNVGPETFYNSATVNGNAVRYPTPLHAMAQPFAFWRGAINFHIKIVKTEFHSGRLLFVYEPGNHTDVLTVSTSEPLYKEILDLRLSNEFTVTVPYVSPYPYARTTNTHGRAILMVETPLRAPSTVNAAVTVIVEASGGPDIEFAGPQSCSFVPILNPQLSPALVVGVEDDGGSLEPQADMGMKTNLVNGSANIAKVSEINEPTWSGGLAPAMLCIGEQITSLRTLLKRSTLWFSFDGAGGGWGWVMNPNRVAVNPNPAAAAATAFNQSDLYDYFGVMFGYKRGGMRVRFYNSSTTQTQQHYGALFYPSAATPLNLPTSVGTTAAANYVGSTTDTVYAAETCGAGIEVEVPQYTYLPFSVNTIGVMPAGTTDNNTLDYSFNLVVAANIQATNPRIFRQISEDFSFGYFLGTLPLVTTTVFASPSRPWV